MWPLRIKATYRNTLAGREIKNNKNLTGSFRTRRLIGRKRIKRCRNYLHQPLLRTNSKSQRNAEQHTPPPRCKEKENPRLPSSVDPDQRILCPSATPTAAPLMYDWDIMAERRRRSRRFWVRAQKSGPSTSASKIPPHSNLEGRRVPFMT